MVYITDKQIAERYQIARSTVWYWISIDKLPQPSKINGRTRWKLSELEKWEANNETS
jgi:predicted DNA-binding transcriptional regulator AlpA